MRTIYTPNHFEVIGDDCFIYLYDKNCFCAAKAIIDTDDYEFIKSYNYKWCLDKKKDRIIAVKTTLYRGKQLKLHSLILKKVNGLFIDHIDRNPLNNKKSNLRLVNYSQSNHNRKVLNKYGYRGVVFDKINKRWKSQITTNKKVKGLGYFRTAVEAHEVYRFEAKKIYGDFFNFNL